MMEKMEQVREVEEVRIFTTWNEEEEDDDDDDDDDDGGGGKENGIISHTAEKNSEIITGRWWKRWNK